MQHANIFGQVSVNFSDRVPVKLAFPCFSFGHKGGSSLYSSNIFLAKVSVAAALFFIQIRPPVELGIHKKEDTSRGTSISIIMQNQIHRDGFMSWGSDRARTLPQTRMNLSHEIGLLFLASPPSTYGPPDYLIRRPDPAARSLSSVTRSVLMAETNSSIDHRKKHNLVRDRPTPGCDRNF